MHLQTIAEVVIAGSGLSLEPGCEQDLTALLTGGEMLVGNEPHRRAEATKNLLTLLAAMIDEATLRGAAELHEWSLSAARARVCPLFPFC